MLSVAPASRSADLAQVADGIWVATSRIWATNSTIIVGERDEALLIDPAVTPAELDAIAAAIAERGWTVVAGASTHPHWDHVLWSRSLADVSFGDCPRFATQKAIDVLRADLEHTWFEALDTAPDLDRAHFAALTPLGTAVSAPPGAIVPLLPPAPLGVRALVHDAHKPGSLALIARGVLIAGDLLSDTEIPLLDLGPGGDLNRAPWDPVADYLWTLECLWNALDVFDVEVLVPGHGSVVSGRAAIRDRIARDRAYLRALESSAKPVVRPWRVGCGNPACWCYTAVRLGHSGDAASPAAVAARAAVLTQAPSDGPRLTDSRLADSENAAAHAAHQAYLAIHRRR